MSRLMTKPTKWHVRPAQTQISLGIRPVWSESLLSAWRNLRSLATHWAHSEDWSSWADAQDDLSLGWVHMSFCWFYHDAAQMCKPWANHKKFSVCCHRTDPEKLPLPPKNYWSSWKRFFFISCSQTQLFNSFCISLTKCSECAAVKRGLTEKGMNWNKCHSLL